MVCSLALDRDDEFFAAAGVSKRIRIYDEERGALSFPLLDLHSRSRLSCVVWNGYVKSQLASADYEGVVQLWDVNTGADIMQYEEHTKRAWSVDFSLADPSRLASGSDDGTVRLWSIHQESSVAVMETHHNVCSVAFSPEAGHLLAAGSVNHKIHLFDIRKPSAPLAVAPGHSKAVSYVKFMPGGRLVSASTDGTLRVWSAPGLAAAGAAGGGEAAYGAACEAVLRGHANERNFVGLTASDDGYVVCGSETNEVVCYHRALPPPVARHSFYGRRRAGGGGGAGGGGARGGGGPGGEDAHFVSAVCWSRRHGTLLAGNSAGHIKVLQLI
ncbi:MAG: WD40-repeat-containing domain protein [Monoraphidium minutum]|nr:MAG: WD40-repeat-containing domain protein [Monoraphidium minutum]